MIKVDTKNMATQAQKMQQIAEQLDNIAASVASVNRTLRWNTSIAYTVRNSLTAYTVYTSHLGEKAAKLGNALQTSAIKYEEAETKIKQCESLSLKEQLEDMIDRYPYHNHYGDGSVLDVAKDALEKLGDIDVLPSIIGIIGRPVTPSERHAMIQSIVDLYDAAKEKGVAGVEWFWEKISGYDLDTEIYETVVEDIVFKALGVDDIDDIAKTAGQFGDVVDDFKTGRFDGETITNIYGVVMQTTKTVGESPFTPAEIKIVGNTLGIVEEYSNRIDKYTDQCVDAIQNGDFVGFAAGVGKSVVTLGRGVVDVSVQTIGDVFMLEEVGAAMSMITGYDIPGAVGDFGSKIADGFDDLFNL